MTDSMVERVAKEICRSQTQGIEVWQAFLPEARAAIEAMREPTPGMLKGAFVAMNQTPSGEWKRLKEAKLPPREQFDAKMLPRWQAMIDAALNGR